MKTAIDNYAGINTALKNYYSNIPENINTKIISANKTQILAHHEFLHQQSKNVLADATKRKTDIKYYLLTKFRKRRDYNWKNVQSAVRVPAVLKNMVHLVGESI